MPPLFQAVTDGFEGISEITGALDIDIGDAFSSPSNMTKALSKGIDNTILAYAGDWDSEIKSYMDRKLGIFDLDEYETIGRDSIKQGVTILPTDQPHSRMANQLGRPWEDDWTLVAADLSVTDVEYDFPSIADISAAIASGEDIPGPDRESSTSLKPIIAPFSLYYPSVAWPFMTDEGKRYTVEDLGNEPIDLPAGDWIGWIMGRKLDRVAALPGFRIWGDPLLGIGASIPVAIVAIPLIITAPRWGQSLGTSLGAAGTAFVTSSAEILGAIGGGLAATGKALVKPIQAFRDRPRKTGEALYDSEGLFYDI